MSPHHLPECFLANPQLCGMHVERRLIVWLAKQALRSTRQIIHRAAVIKNHAAEECLPPKIT